MARKPLINTGEDNLSYTSNAAYNMLLSGNMIPVKRRVLTAVLHKKNVPVVVINLDNTSPYMNISHYDYSISDSSTGYDIFSMMSIREVCSYLQNTAYEKGYDDEKAVQIIKYLSFIEKLNSYLNLNLPTIRDINDHYYKPDIIGNKLSEMYNAGKITPDEYDRLNVSLIRSIKGQLIIDNILASVDFNLNFDCSSSFSISNIKCGETKFIDLSARHNSYTEKKRRSDILYSIEGCSIPMTIVLNLGKADFNLVENFLANTVIMSNRQFIVMMDDVFAQVQNHDTIRRKFSLNLLGQHTGDSCKMMEGCFHEIYKQEKHYARSVDSKLFADRFIDVIFHTNHTDTTTLVPVSRNVIEQEDIANLSDRTFIMMDNTGTTNYFSIYNI